MLTALNTKCSVKFVGSHRVQTKSSLIIPSYIHNILTTSVLNFIKGSIQGRAPVCVRIVTNGKTFSCLLANNVC